MSNYNWRELYNNAFQRAEWDRWLYGILGHPDGTLVVPGRAGFLYVRVGSQGGLTPTIARDVGKTAQQLNLPVKMYRDASGNLVIDGLDDRGTRAAVATSTAGGNSNGVADHHHRSTAGAGLRQEVEGKMLEPGRVRSAGTTKVYANPLRYLHNGVWQTFLGSTLNLTPYKPATVGHWAWVLVGLDPDTNTLVAAAGTSQLTSTALTLDQLDDIAFDNWIPLGAVRVRQSDTAFTNIADYFDSKGWVNQDRLTDHGALTGLADDDHTQYLLAAGTRALSGDWDIGEDMRILLEALRARDAEGIAFERSNGTVAFYLLDSNGYVGVGTTSPGAPLHLVRALGSFTPITDEVLILQRNSAVSQNAVLTIVAGNTGRAIIRLTDADAAEAGKVEYNNNTNAMSFYTNGVADRLVVDSSGRIGNLTTLTSLSGQLHFHDGTGGFIQRTLTGINSTTDQVLIPNAAGDVTRALVLNYVATDGSSGTAGTTSMLPGDTRDVTVGTLTVRFTLNANGSLLVKRQAGTGSATVNVQAIWI